MSQKVNTYIEGLPEDRKELCERLRDLILETVPEAEEKLSFGIPFYHYFGMFMYLNNTKEGIDFAVCRGKDLLKAFPVLELKNRATIATVTITDKKQIAQYELRQLVSTAAEWNKEAKRLNIPFVKKPAKKKIKKQGR